MISPCTLGSPIPGCASGLRHGLGPGIGHRTRRTPTDCSGCLVPGTTVSRPRTVAEASGVRPIYYRELQPRGHRLCAGRADESRARPTRWRFRPQRSADTAIEKLPAFNSSQREYVLGEIPEASPSRILLPTQSGYPRTTTSAIALQGRADAVKTRTIQVNGLPATWSAWEASWNITGVPVHPDSNQIRLNRWMATDVFESAVHDVWYDDGRSPPGTTIAGNTTWSAADGPFQITGNLTVASGATPDPHPRHHRVPRSREPISPSLRRPDSGRGTAEAPIRFTCSPGSASAWGGIVLNGAARPRKPDHPCAHRVQWNHRH